MFQCFQRFIFLIIQCLEHFDYIFFFACCCCLPFLLSFLSIVMCFDVILKNCKIFNNMRGKRKSNEKEVETLCTKSKQKVLILFICSFRVFSVLEENLFIQRTIFIFCVCWWLLKHLEFFFCYSSALLSGLYCK